MCVHQDLYVARNSIALPPGQKCSRWVRRHNGISFSPARLLKKVYWRRRQYPFYIKKTCRWIADWVLWPVRKISQPIHVQWIRRPDYYEKILRYRKSIGLPPGQKCSRWVPRDTTESLFLQQDCWEKYTSHSVSLISLLKNFFIYKGSDDPRDKQNQSSRQNQ